MDNKAMPTRKGRSSSSSSSQRSFRPCSICSSKFYIAASENSPRTANSGKKSVLPSAMAGMLDASFVNIHSPTHVNNENDIHSILNDALSHDNYHAGRGGTDALHDASVKLAAYAEAAMEMIRAENSDNNSDEKGDDEEKFYCGVCIERLVVQ